MKLENQVISLDLAKRLKELGVKQDSYFNWVKGLDEPCHEWIEDEESPVSEIYSAFTVAELGEMLPGILETKDGEGYREDWYIRCGWNDMVCNKEFSVEYMSWKRSGESYKDKFIIANTEANARAKMLVYLLENDLIKL